MMKIPMITQTVAGHYVRDSALKRSNAVVGRAWCVAALRKILKIFVHHK